MGMHGARHARKNLHVMLYSVLCCAVLWSFKNQTTETAAEGNNLNALSSLPLHQHRNASHCCHHNTKHTAQRSSTCLPKLHMAKLHAASRTQHSKAPGVMHHDNMQRASDLLGIAPRRACSTQQVARVQNIMCRNIRCHDSIANRERQPRSTGPHVA